MKTLWKTKVPWKIKKKWTNKKGETVSKKAREQGNFKKEQWPVIKRPLHLKRETNSSVTSVSWSGALKFHTTTHPHSCTNHDSSTCPLCKWHVCKSIVCAPHTPAVANRMYVCLQYTLQRSEKGIVVKSDDFPYLTHQRHVHLEELDRSSLNNTCPSSST